MVSTAVRLSSESALLGGSSSSAVNMLASFLEAKSNADQIASAATAASSSSSSSSSASISAARTSSTTALSSEAEMIGSLLSGIDTYA